MSQYPSDWKQCATCEYWAGERRPANIFGERVEFESPMAKGRCMNRASGWYSSPGKQANFSCNCWEKWAVLEALHNH